MTTGISTYCGNFDHTLQAFQAIVGIHYNNFKQLWAYIVGISRNIYSQAMVNQLSKTKTRLSIINHELKNTIALTQNSPSYLETKLSIKNFVVHRKIKGKNANIMPLQTKPWIDHYTNTIFDRKLAAFQTHQLLLKVTIGPI